MSYVLPSECIPGVPWPPGFKADFDEWAGRFFSPSTRSERRPKKDGASAMSRVLGNLDATFANLRRDLDPDWGVGIPMSKTDLAGLRKSGPLVVDGLDLSGEKPFPSDNAMLPSHVFVALNLGDKSDSDHSWPDFGFAIKMRTTPWIVARVKGQAWMFGLAWRKKSGRHLWAVFYAFTREGRVIPTHWLCSQHVMVKGGAYTRRTWETASWRPRGEDQESTTRAVLSTLLHAYTRRDDKWTVAVRKDGLRVRFLIDGTATAAAFADRSITALAADGKRKRIIHFVREHMQARGDRKVSIPAHIRGLREFDWHGYHVYVTSPRFHAFADVSFTAAGEDMPEDMADADGYVSTLELQNRLVGLEDELNTRRNMRAYASMRKRA